MPKGTYFLMRFPKQLKPMKKFPTKLIALALFSTLFLLLQSCDDGNVQLEKSKVQFALSPANASDGRVKPIALPENVRLRISVESTSGSETFSEHEIQVSKNGDAYLSDALDLLPGAYVITDFMIVKDDEVLNAAPRSESPFSSFVRHSLPFKFSITETGVARVDMQVVDARNARPEAFGYASFKMNKLSFMVSTSKGRKTPLRDATAELRQGKQLIKTFSVKHGLNNIAFEGERDADYTLSVYAGDVANVKTFNYKALKKELGPKPLRITLEPALVLTLESSVDEVNEYGEYFEFVLDGAGGSVNVNWGDGRQSSYTLPMNGEHDYTMGTYTAVVTGDLNRITNLYGFSYGTIIYGIEGLTNLPALKTYNPSWGAVPINVDLSNCKKLETVHVEKYGAPYEPIDLRTDFKLPADHFIKEFVFYVPSLDPTRENISTAELEVLVDNIYNNTTRRKIYEGKFLVYPVDAPSAETQRKLDILQNDYNWDVRLDGNIWEDGSESGRAKQDLDARRENWLRDKFPGKKRSSRNASMVFAD